jgi:uncharacterized protein
MAAVGNLALGRDDGRVICERVVVADTMYRRLRGLLGRPPLKPGEGIVLRPAAKIDTAFLSFPIDVVFIDRDQVVTKVVEQLRPWRKVSCGGARDVVELAAGECERLGVRVGDRVAWLARRADGMPAAARTGDAANGGEAGRPTVRVLLASRDGRFVRLAEFLLDRRGLEVRSTRRTRALADLVAEVRPDVLVLDVSDSPSAAARAIAVIEARHPEISVIVVASDGSVNGAGALHALPKWEAAERLADEIETAYNRRRGFELAPAAGW